MLLSLHNYLQLALRFKMVMSHVKYMHMNMQTILITE